MDEHDLNAAVLATLLLAAFLLDLAAGDPAWRLHPVRLMGGLASRLESWLYRDRALGLATGLMMAVVHPALVLTAYLAIRLPSLFLPGDLAMIWSVGVDTLALYGCLAFRDLYDHVRPILAGLQRGDLPAAQAATQRIVGRDASLLDESGVARAAIESSAESLSDGLVGPVFWFTVLGIGALASGPPATRIGVAATAGALCFRAVNTLDSMVGYRGERYLHFGRASARFDDLLGFLPARITVLCLAAAALLLRLDVRGGVAIWWRDRNLHPSPNAGQSESLVAGALSLRLGGPSAYAHGVVDKPWLGDGCCDATASHLQLASRLVWRAGVLAMFAALLATLAFLFV